MSILKRYLTQEGEIRLIIDMSLDSQCMIHALIEDELRQGIGK